MHRLNLNLNLCQPAAMSGESQPSPERWREHNFVQKSRESARNVRSPKHLLLHQVLKVSLNDCSSYRRKGAVFNIVNETVKLILPLPVTSPTSFLVFCGVTSKINFLHQTTASGRTYIKTLSFKKIFAVRITTDLVFLQTTLTSDRVKTGLLLCINLPPLRKRFL